MFKLNADGKWSNIKYLEGLAINGNNIMKNPIRQSSNMTGNDGNGYIIIKRVS